MKILKFGGSSLATSDCIRGVARIVLEEARRGPVIVVLSAFQGVTNQDRKSTRLNSSHTVISYAVFCLKKKNRNPLVTHTPDHFLLTTYMSYSNVTNLR